MTKLAALGAVLGIALAAARAGAQAPSSPPGQSGAEECLAAIPSSELTRVPVFASVQMVDGERHSVPPDLANTLQEVGDRARALVSNGADTLPAGEPALTWRDLGGFIHGVWHRDGRLTSSFLGDSSRGIRLLARALGDAQGAGETFMVWPDTVKADSLAFYFSLVRPLIDTTGAVEAITQRPVVPVFTIAAPRQRLVGHKGRGVPPSYPGGAMAAGATGTVILQFVVDTAGHADMTTVHDIWPADRPRLTGRLADYYKDFLTTARSSIENTRFVPARTGRCAVRQVVVEPFTFDIR